MRKKTLPGEAKRFLNETVLRYSGEDCLQWPFNRLPNGYGYIQFEGMPRPVSRVVCIMTKGRPPTPKHEAAHSCGKGHEGCCNPNHLSWKTSSENKADQLLHGTDKRGVKHFAAKLNDEAVREILAMKGKVRRQELADKFGVSYSRVASIQNGDGWGHLRQFREVAA